MNDHELTELAVLAARRAIEAGLSSLPIDVLVEAYKNAYRAIYEQAA